MTTIRTTCPRCGEVDMGPEAILLQVVRGGREGTYRFTCPTCMDAVEKRADRKIVALLVSAGVDVASRGTITEEAERDPAERLFEEPEQFLHPLDRLPEGPRLTADDLIDFHFRLQDDAYIQEFLAKR
ncbi:MAG: hypothetical protein ABI879_03070 [Actinomycetota bacterium]|jgi:predicted RNA-binding Zn-ribbon protein involved in translation (DUF1610 family)